MFNSEVFKSLKTRINASYRKTSECLLETALLCAEAQRTLSKADLDELGDQLEMDRPTFCKVKRIGADERLYAEDVKAMLPPSFSIVYELAKLSVNKFAEALQQNRIQPGMSRKSIQDWIGGRARVDEAMIDIGKVRVPVTFSPKKIAKLEQALRNLGNEYGCDIRLIQDAKDERALERSQTVSQIYLRDECRRYIARMKKRRLMGKKGKAERQKAWGFPEDETDIPQDATEEVILSVMDIVGAADEFVRFRDEARAMVGVASKARELGPDEEDDIIIDAEKPEPAEKSRQKERFAGFK